MPEKYYQNKLYPFQDKVLKTMDSLDVDFYLTGGTALGRCYLGHRYSDDLDFFVNNHSEFKSQCNSVLDFLRNTDWNINISTATESFLRIFLEDDGVSLKIDFINDISFHYGDFISFPIFKKVDNWRNILSNKLCALTRMEPKDIVDIIFISGKYSFEWETIIEEAKKKDLWVDPLEICKILNDFPVKLLIDIKWIDEINIDEVYNRLKIIHDDIFYGRSNSLNLN